MVTSTGWELVAVAVLAGAFGVSLGIYAILKLRARRNQIKGELSDSPTFADDRAHNQIAFGRSQAERLSREGYDVSRATALLDQAERELARRRNVDSVRSALEAQRVLRDLRNGGAVPWAPPPGATAPRSPPATPGFSAAPPAGPSGAPAGPLGVRPEAEPAEMPRPPKNRMEAHFQMTLLVEEIARRGAAASTSGPFAEAEKLRAGAQAAYAKGDYTEALRLALRGRRQLGSALETLPPAPVKAGGAAPAPAEDTNGGTARCPTCGRVATPGDGFCRGCGGPMGRPSTCARCQAPLTPADTFCGRCGAPVS